MNLLTKWFTSKVPGRRGNFNGHECRICNFHGTLKWRSSIVVMLFLEVRITSFKKYLPNYGTETYQWVPTNRENGKLLFGLNTKNDLPGNSYQPGLDIIDLELVSALAKCNITYLRMPDNCLATPNQRPIGIALRSCFTFSNEMD